MSAPITRRDAAYPGYAMFRQGDIEVTAAPAISPADEAYISEKIRHASNYRYLTRCAQGMGYDSATDALADLAKRRAAPSVDTPKFRKLLAEWWIHAGSEDEHAAKVALQALIGHLDEGRAAGAGKGGANHG